MEKLLGYEVAGFIVPGFAGEQIMSALGYGETSEPWIPAGIGINSGLAYVGSIHTEGGVANIAILGDSVNTTARLTSLAGVGEILISDAIRQAAGLDGTEMESRSQQLKGKSQAVTSWVLKPEY